MNNEDMIRCCRAMLCRTFPGIELMLAAAVFEESDRTETLALSGNRILYSRAFARETFGRDREGFCRGILHMLLHRICGHRGRDLSYPRETWDISCDIAAEWLLDDFLELRSRADFGCSKENRILLHEITGLLSRRGLGPSPWQIAGLLSQEEDETCAAVREILSLSGAQACLCFDDHSLWDPQKDREEEGISGLMLRQSAGRAGFGTGANLRGSGPGDLERIEDISSSGYDYRRWLKRFAHMREEVDTDPENFDLIYYSFGMQMYGNLPLIEELEYREVNRLDNMVIAIDTSGSCSTETVRGFLEHTYSILEERENFFRKMNVILLQCDDDIRDVRVIRSREEWFDYCSSLVIRGRTDTDFTPVCRWIDRERAGGRIKKPQALLYFTDGNGVFPGEPQDYPCAFLFTEKNRYWDMVPAWAGKLLVSRTGSQGYLSGEAQRMGFKG